MKKLLLISFFSFMAMGSPQGVPTQSTVTCGLSSGVLVAANPNRGYLIFQNQGDDASGHCHVKAGSAITGTEGLWIDQKQNYETVEAFTKQAWYCKCDSASQTMEVLQTNY